MQKENSNLPVVVKKSFMKRFKEKLQTFFLMGMSLLGVVTPYVDAAAEVPKDVEPLSKTSINEVIKEDVEAKYEQAFSNLGITITNDKSLADKEGSEMKVEDDPPEEKREDKILERPGDKTELPDPGADKLLKFYRSLTLNVNDDIKKYREFKNESKPDISKDER
ncbi:MAG: hypothetical protein K0R72_221 [Clostridia bacterium]|jgi:hypothetical protein|nr:hypothetical protein [Clostridia bacterium]